MGTALVRLSGLAIVSLLLLSPLIATVGAAPVPQPVALSPGQNVQPPPPDCELLNDPVASRLMSGNLELKLMVKCGLIAPDQVRLGPPMVSAPWQPTRPTQATDIQITAPEDGTSDATTQSETSIAVRGQTVVATYNDDGIYTGASGIQSFSGYAYSNDGGATWTDGGYVVPGPSDGTWGDPSVAYRAADDYFYYASLSDSGLSLWRSTDEGHTFNYVGPIHSSGGDDKELMAIDNTGGAYDGRMYAMWTDFNASAHIYSTYSTDAGASWSTAIDLSGESNVQGAWPTVAPNGDVYVAWLAGRGASNISQMIARSTNGGVSFSAPVPIVDGVPNPGHTAYCPSSGTRDVVNGDVRYLPSPQIAVGPDGRLHATYSYRGVGADEIDVFYNYSDDNGVTWGHEHKLNDDATTTDQFYPSIAVNDNNIVVTAWYDRRNDPTNNLVFERWMALSYDGGNSWQPNVNASDAPSPVPPINPNFAPYVHDCYMGDYDWITMDDTAAYLIWSDSRNFITTPDYPGGRNDPDVWFEKDYLIANPSRLQGHVTYNPPIAGALVTASGWPTSTFSTSSLADGAYGMTVAPYTYTVTAQAYGFQTWTATDVVAPAGTTTTLDITMTAASTYVVSGAVTDATTGDPLQATITIAGDPFDPPTTTLQTDPATGFYSIALAEDITYTFDAAALLHTPDSTAVGPLTGDQTVNFALTATTTDGLLWGQVTSLATGDPIAGATIQATPGLTSTQSLADGAYQLQLPSGTAFTITVSAPLYSTMHETGVILPQSNLLERNYALPTAHMVLTPPAGMDVVLAQGDQVTHTLTISNSGAGALDFEIAERDRGFTPLVTAPRAGEDVLVVNRLSSTAATAIETALTALGYTYLEISETTFQTMAVNDLLAYDLLIWVGSTGATGTADNDNELLLMPYLDAGGPLLITDNDLGYYRHDSTFYDTYMHAVYGVDDATDTDTSPQLVDGLDLMAPLVVDLTTEPYPDGVIARDAAATPLFEAEGPADPTYPYVGLAINDPSYQAVYLAFDYNYVGTTNHQQEILVRACDWLIQSEIPWLTVAPATGAVPADTELPITLGFNAIVITQPGTYAGDLRFYTNDPAAQPFATYPVTLTVLGAPPELRIAKTASAAAVRAGLDTLVYTITVDNAGGLATGVVISDALPAHTELAWASGGGALVGAAVTWSRLRVDIGGQIVVSYGVEVTCVTSGTQIVNDMYQVHASEWPTPTWGAPVTATATAPAVVADFALATPVLLHQPVAFTNQSQNANAYQWAFGDGATSTQANPSHAYTGNTGDHTVVLTASNPCAYDVTSQIVTVHNYAAAIAPATATASGDPGTIVSYTLRVTNTGTLPDVFQILLSSHTWATQLSTTTLALDPGASAPVQVQVTAPASAAGDDHDSVQVTARSTNDPRLPAAAASATLNTGANGVYAVTLGPAASAQTGNPNEVIMYTLQVTNTGNTVDTITFARTAPGWDTSFSAPSLVIAAGGRRTIQVYVTIPATVANGQADVAVIRATGTGNHADVTLTTTASAGYQLYLPLILRN